MSLRMNRGFTLIELLVIIAIIALLAAILTPAFGRALRLARRGTCATNIKDIVGACAVYANTAREHRGMTVEALPVAAGIDASNWWRSSNGNWACVWLLVKYDYVSPKVFNCPAMRDHTPALKSATGFGRDRCSYSFISMVGRGGAGAPPVLTTDNAPRSMVIVGDLNPRFTHDPWENNPPVINAALNGQNSATHGTLNGRNEGQNVGKLDGTATWLTRPDVVTGSTSGDLIYQSKLAGGDTSGQASDAEDVFLIP